MMQSLQKEIEYVSGLIEEDGYQVAFGLRDIAAELECCFQQGFTHMMCVCESLRSELKELR